jgi:hypothetical protein
MLCKAGWEIAAYPRVLPLRRLIDERFPKPFASYR